MIMIMSSEEEEKEEKRMYFCFCLLPVTIANQLNSVCRGTHLHHHYDGFQLSIYQRKTVCQNKNKNKTEMK